MIVAVVANCLAALIDIVAQEREDPGTALLVTWPELTPRMARNEWLRPSG